jgi:hypothetical protein
MTQAILNSKPAVSEDAFNAESLKVDLEIEKQQARLREEMLVKSKSLSE